MYMNRNDSYEYESEELDEEKEERRRKLIKGIFFSILVIIVVIIVLLLLKGCGKTEVNRYDDLVKAAKAYYEEEKDKLPEFYGEQATVTLKDLKDADLLENPDAFSVAEIKTRRILLIVSSVIAGTLAAVVIAFAVLLGMAVAFM